MIRSSFDALAAHAAQEAPREACGLIVQRDGGEVYVPCRNVAENPQTFELHAEDWDGAEASGRLLAVCHSHPQGPATPSRADVRGCTLSGIPWLILGAQGDLQRIDPEEVPLRGRPFVYGWQDCYTLVRDHFAMERSVILPDFPREPSFAASPYLQHFEDCGFVEVEEAQPGDVLIMRVATAAPCHAGIYLGQGRVLHHLAGRLSCAEPLGALAHSITHRLRHAC